MKDQGGPRLPLRIVCNGSSVQREVSPDATLQQFLHDELDDVSVKKGCGEGVCGSCTVLVDGRSVKSCTMLAVQADGRDITTIEGMAGEDGLHPLQRAFHENHGLQCGYCTPGMIMAADSLIRESEGPLDEAGVRIGLEGNLCRCTGYHNIVKAVLAASETMKAGAPGGGGS